MTADATMSPAPEAAPAHWVPTLRGYFPILALANLAWEAVHLPLYTVWTEGSPGYLLFVVVHCTGGDVLIALCALTAALLLAAPSGWPRAGFHRVGVVATAAGVGYTIFSEWLNLVVRESWQYSDLMPVVPLLEVGLSPLLQWVIIPPVSLWAARRLALRRVTPAA